MVVRGYVGNNRDFEDVQELVEGIGVEREAATLGKLVGHEGADEGGATGESPRVGREAA